MSERLDGKKWIFIKEFNKLHLAYKFIKTRQSNNINNKKYKIINQFNILMEPKFKVFERLCY